MVGLCASVAVKEEGELLLLFAERESSQNSAEGGEESLRFTYLPHEGALRAHAISTYLPIICSLLSRGGKITYSKGQLEYLVTERSVNFLTESSYLKLKVSLELFPPHFFI